MKLLALDQASRVTGYSIWDNDKLITYGKISLDNNDLGERLCLLKQKIIKLIEDNDIDYLAFEDIQLQSNVANNIKTFKTLAEVFGVVHELSYNLKIPYEIVLAGTWKSSLGIKGKNRAEQKRNAQRYVLNTYGIKATQDESDAICIGAHVTKKQKAFDWSN